MRPKSHLVTLSALALLLAGCSGGGIPQVGQPAAAQPTTSAVSGGAGSSAAAATVRPAAQAGAQSAAPPPSGGGASGDLQKVPLPSGSKYDPWMAPKIGDTVELPITRLVLQVTGARTMDFDANADLVLVELIIGNKNNKPYTVSSVILTDIVSGDWHWYGLSLDDLMKVAAKIGPMGIKTFDTDLKPGEAMKGTVVIPVPKSAQRLAFAFHPLNTDNPLEVPDPTVYVSLGIRGDFQPPMIPEAPPAVTAGTMYKQSQPVLATKRGVAIQANSVRELTKPSPGLSLGADQKFVIVDLTMRTFGEAKGLTQQEVTLEDSTGDTTHWAVGDAMSVAKVEQSRTLDATVRRGLLIFRVPRDAKGFALKVQPIDPKSPVGQNVYLQEEAFAIDLGGAAAQAAAPAAATPTKAAAPAPTAVPTKPASSVATAVPTKPAAAAATPVATSPAAVAATAAPATPVVIQAAPTPTQVSTIVAPPLANPSVLPAELKPIPIPPGFGIVDKSARRSASGGVFRSATVQLWGTKSIDEVVSFYTTALATDWTSYNEIVKQDYLDLTYFLTSDEGRSLQFTGQASAEGLYIDVMLRQE